MTSSPTSPGHVAPGVYRHYKNKEYLVIGCATHSETGEILVVYRALYGERGLWVRPLSMFFDQVRVEGSVVSRFTFVRKE